MKKRLLPVGAVLLGVVIGLFMFAGEDSGNVESGLGQMGARFNMDLEEFTQGMNDFYQETFFYLEDWDVGEQTTMDGTNELFDNYFYSLDEDIMLQVVVEASTGKIGSVNFMAPFDDGSQEQMQGCYAVMCGMISVLADVDMDEATNIADTIIENNTSSPMEYNNILFKIVSSSTQPIFMVVPASDEVLSTMDIIEID